MAGDKGDTSKKQRDEYRGTPVIKLPKTGGQGQGQQGGSSSDDPSGSKSSGSNKNDK